MEQFALFAALSLLSVKILDLIKNIQGGRTKDALTQIAAFITGVGIVLLGAQTAWAAGVAVGGVVLGNMNVASQVLLGLTMSGTGQWLYDVSPRSTPSLGERAPD